MRTDKRFAVVLAVSLLWALLVTAIFTRVAGAGKAPGRRGRRSRWWWRRARCRLAACWRADAVKLRSVPERLFPSGGFSRLEDVLDRPVISPIQAEEPVLEARIAARGSGIGLGPMIPPGMRAISVRVNDVVGVAGFVLPGMRVDVLVTGQAVDASGHRHPHGAAEYRGALGGADHPERTGKSAISTPVVTLLVTPDDAESLTLANNEGHIQLVLRNSADEVLANPRGRQLNDIYAPRTVCARLRL